MAGQQRQQQQAASAAACTATGAGLDEQQAMPHVAPQLEDVEVEYLREVGASGAETACNLMNHISNPPVPMQHPTCCRRLRTASSSQPPE